MLLLIKIQIPAADSKLFFGSTILKRPTEQTKTLFQNIPRGSLGTCECVFSTCDRLLCTCVGLTDLQTAGRTLPDLEMLICPSGGSTNFPYRWNFISSKQTETFICGTLTRHVKYDRRVSVTTEQTQGPRRLLYGCRQLFFIG